jgi:hypothetical protein
LIRCKLRRSCFAAFKSAAATKADRRWVFALFLRRRFTVLDLANGNIDKELGELGWVARAFFAF